MFDFAVRKEYNEGKSGGAPRCFAEKVAEPAGMGPAESCEERGYRIPAVRLRRSGESRYVNCFEREIDV